MTACFGIVRLTLPAELVGSATGVVNSLTVASGAVLQPLVGLALDLLQSDKLKSGTSLYQATDYRYAFIIILLTCICGFIVALCLEDKD